FSPRNKPHPGSRWPLGRDRTHDAICAGRHLPPQFAPMTGRALPFYFGTGSLGMYLRLSAMVFLDAAILACVVPLLAIYMRHAHGFSAREMSTIYAIGPFASILAPVLVGQLADRLFAAQKVLATVNLLRAAALFAAARADSYGEFLVAMTLVFLLQVPSLTL